jgi:predicted lipoprotein with Yx(FWY)xxD motif
MARPSSRRSLFVAAAVMSSLSLAAATGAATAIGASTNGHSATSHRALVKLEKSKKYGKILVNSHGRTLYLLTSDTRRSLACTGGCTGLWPPLLTKGKPRAGKGVKVKKLGTVKRGSSRQVTYDGHPLYLYAGDSGSGQVNGEGIKSFGGTWYVLSRSGSAVKKAVSSSSSSTGSSGGGYGGGY